MAAASATAKKSVSTGPGFTLSTRTPCLRASTPTASVNRSTNALDALYVAMDGSGWNPATEPMLTIAPLRAAVMVRSAAWVRVMSARTLTVSSSSSRSRSSVANSPWLPKPALLTSRSTGSCSRTRTRASIPSWVPRSAATVRATPPVTSWERAVSFSSLRPVSTSAQPRSCSARANARPIPPVAPVTSAVRVTTPLRGCAATAASAGRPPALPGRPSRRCRRRTPHGTPGGPTCPHGTRVRRRRTS